MRHPFEYANLYVEKYDNGKLILDFTVESEFLYFAYNGDYTEKMNLQTVVGWKNCSVQVRHSKTTALNIDLLNLSKERGKMAALAH